MRKPLSDFADDPVYNMKAVEQLTQIPAATLRAWERRYALIEPKRTPTGYRLYSDRDVALLRWVRTQMDTGLTISRVVVILETLHASGEPIWVDLDAQSALTDSDAPLPPRSLVSPLFEALKALDEKRADEIMQQAFALYTTSTVYIEIVAPTLTQVGDAWHRGEIYTTLEHFASAYLRGRLLTLLQAYLPRPDMPRLFVGCAPEERHEVGALIFSVMLRQHGYNAIYLGQDVPIDDLLKTAARNRPAMICLSASSSTTALHLRELRSKLATIEAPAPLFGYGGRAFDNDPDLRKVVTGHYLGSDLREARTMVGNLLKATHAASAR